MATLTLQQIAEAAVAGGLDATEVEAALLAGATRQLRDEFAMSALSALCTPTSTDFVAITQRAYQAADAMLLARSV